MFTVGKLQKQISLRKYRKKKFHTIANPEKNEVSFREIF